MFLTLAGAAPVTTVHFEEPAVNIVNELTGRRISVTDRLKVECPGFFSYSE